MFTERNDLPNKTFVITVSENIVAASVLNRAILIRSAVLYSSDNLIVTRQFTSSDDLSDNTLVFTISEKIDATADWGREGEIGRAETWENV
jgi:hypothetical protein